MKRIPLPYLSCFPLPALPLRRVFLGQPPVFYRGKCRCWCWVQRGNGVSASGPARPGQSPEEITARGSRPISPRFGRRIFRRLNREQKSPAAHPTPLEAQESPTAPARVRIRVSRLRFEEEPAALVPFAASGVRRFETPSAALPFL